ncbi:MAG: CHASE2 domain-containing protein [Methylococcaceae bacterium]
MRISSRWVVVLVALKKLSSFLGILLRPRQFVHAMDDRFQYAGHGLASKWQALTRFQRHVLTNMLIGLGIAIGLTLLHGNKTLRDLEDGGVDWAMRLYRGTPSSVMNVPMVLFDIDEKTHRSWGEPVSTPRDKLLDLIRLAVESQAAVVVVDIDVSRRLSDTNADNALKDYLAGLSACGENPKQACAGKPLIVLMRTFHGQLPAEKEFLRQQRASFLDDVVARSANIVWANPAFFRDWDGVVRRWLLWEPTCRDQVPHALPSVQLAVAAYLTEKELGVRTLLAQLDSLRPETCKKSADFIELSERSADKIMDLGKHQINLRDVTLQQRILYRIPWLIKAEAKAKIDFNGQKVDVFSTRTAHSLTDAKQPIDTQSLKGRIVLIGNSTQDSRDFYQTPLGKIMPGVVILSNAIHSLMEHGQFRPPSLWLKLVIEALLILIMSYLFARFNSFWGMFISGLTIVVALIPLSVWMFGQGLWIDFAIPLLAVELHEMAAEFETSVKQKKELEHG